MQSQGTYQHRKSTRCVRRSVTLVELVIVMVIVGVLTAISSMFIKSTIDLWLYANYRNETMAQARVGLLRMAREMRQNKDATSIYVASATQYRFIDVNNATIEYRVSGNSLVRRLNSGADDILASGVTALTLIFYDADNAVVATPLVNPQQTDISRIQIQLRVRSGTQEKTWISQVFLRNII
jgi:Tfp pilus assembly protein FimT